jgi:hypothetical protein
MKRIVTAAVLLVAGLSGATAWAHPGHGMTPPDSAVHYAIEPAHGWRAPLVLCVVLAAAALGIAVRRQRRRALARASARRSNPHR